MVVGSGASLSGGVVKNILGNVAGPLAGLASAPILAHALGVDGRGEVAAATAPFLLISTLATLGIPEAATYFVAKNERVFRTVRARASLVLVLTGILATGLGLAIAPLLAVDDPNLVTLIMFASLAIVPTVLVGLLRGVAAGLAMWTSVAIERALGPMIRLIAIVVLAVTGGLDVVTATICIVVSPVLGGVIYLVHRSRIKHSSDSPVPSHVALLNYGSRVWLGSVAGVLLMRIDQVLMVPLSSTYQLGLYVVAVTISELPLVVNTAVREVMFASDARSTVDSRLTRAARISLVVCLIVAVAIAAPSVWWVPLLFGEGFREAIPTMLILLVGVIAGIPGSIAGSGLSARGLPQLRSYSLVVAFMVNLIVVLLLVPVWGAAGAALATVLGNVVSSNINVIQMKRRFGVPFWSFYLIRVQDLRDTFRLVHRVLKR